MKAIETNYKGYRFRSRLEARWAIFFDTLKIKYIYEPEGFELSDGTMYLPDFYLPESKTFAEVKGIMNEVDQHKIDQFRDDSNVNVVVLNADFSFEASESYYPEKYLPECGCSYFAQCCVCGCYYFLGHSYGWICPGCGHYDGNNGFYMLAHSMRMDDGARETTWYDTDALNAVRKAQRARFEHGEVCRSLT